MLYTKEMCVEKLALAHKLAKEYHKDDKYGDKPYYDYHLCGVFTKVKNAGYSTIYQIVSLLHDLKEDHKYPIDLIVSQFGYEIAMAVDAISYRKGEETKSEYWTRCSKNEIASVVKYFDAKFNKDHSYYEFDDKRAKYYATIQSIMNNAMGNHTMKSFIETLEKVGGVYTVEELEKVDLTNAIFLSVDDSIVCPKFQFKESENGLVLKPMIEYVILELKKRTKFSNVRLTNFFTIKHDYPGHEEKINLIDLFKTEMTLDQQMHLDIRIQNAGTNNLL